MPEAFCRSEPDLEAGKRFIALVKAHDAVGLDQLLASDAALRERINAHWFCFDAPAVLQAKHDLATVDVLLKHGANLNERSSWWAGGFGVLDGVSRPQFDALVARGATIGIHNGAEQGDAELVRRLLADDPTAARRAAGDGQHPLHVAATEEVAELLLQAGADLEARDVDHFATPAQYQVARPEVCRWLISRGAQPDIFMACALGDHELVESILREDPSALTSRVGHCPHTSPVHGPAGGHIYLWVLHGAATPIDVARQFEHPALHDWLRTLTAP